MINVLLVVNIVASYAVWTAFTWLFYSKIKNMLVFVIITLTMYALVPLHYALIHDDVLVTTPTVLSYILALKLRGGKDFLQTVLIPLPTILTSVYLLVV